MSLKEESGSIGQTDEEKTQEKKLDRGENTKKTKKTQKGEEKDIKPEEGQSGGEKTKSKKKPQKGKEKDIYFIIYFILNKKEDPKEIAFSKECEESPNVILAKEVKTKNNKYAYKKVFKYKNIDGKKDVELIYYYGEGLDKYIINLKAKDKTFVYDVDFKKGHRYLSKVVPQIIKQEIKYQDKLDLFLEALEKNKEESKIHELYKETIELYSKNSSFSFLISLFVKIYQDKNFCESLIEKFYKMNDELKEKSKKDLSTNSDRDDNLGDQFNSIMAKIESESESLIASNGYKNIHFYGIIISYFNFYDYSIFINCFNKLYKKEKGNILYEILLVYYSQFFKPPKKDESDKEFFINFFKYIILEKDLSYLAIGLRFVSDIDTFILVIDETKDEIYNKYIKNNNNSDFKPIILEDNLELKEGRIDAIIKGIKSIYDFSKEKNNLLVHFKSNFWKSLLKEFDKPEPKCFKICINLRKIFIEYNRIIESLCKDKNENILKDIGEFYKNDEFAYLLNEKIKIFFKNNKGKLKNMEILGYIEEYNPYYQEDNYKFKREAYILDDLVFKYDLYNEEEEYKNDYSQFIETFKKLEYEEIFKDNMVKFIELMINKIEDLSSFDTVMNLIRVDKIEGQINEYIEKLQLKYENIIKEEIKNLGDKQLKKPVEIIAKFEKLIFDKENKELEKLIKEKKIDEKVSKEKKTGFLKNNIDKLKINFQIYNQLMLICNDDKYLDMKEYIYNKYLNNIEKIDSIITLIDSLQEKDKENFLKQLMKKCKFNKDEYYSTKNNNKINLFCALHEKKNLEKVSGDIETTLGEIIADIDKGEIEKKKLEEFFENKEEVVKKRLRLIKLNMPIFEPVGAYDSLKKTLKDIKDDISALSKIKKSLSIFLKETFQDDIRQMAEFINKLENIKIKEYNDDKFVEPIKKLKAKFEKTAEEVDLVQDFLLFKVIYENEKGRNQDMRFQKANEKMKKIKESLVKEKENIDKIYEENKKIFNNIKLKLVNNEQRTKEFFKTLKKYLFEENQENEDNKKLMDDLILLFSSKKYELDLKSIFYFFNSYNKEDEWSKELAQKYGNLSEMKLKELKTNLEALEKKEKIYVYKDQEMKNNYSNLFTSLYEKKEAIDFLRKKAKKKQEQEKKPVPGKTNHEIQNKYPRSDSDWIRELYDRIDPNSPTLTIQKIDDTKKCIEVFDEFQSKKNNKEIFDYIKTLNNEQINAFMSYSKIFSSIIELDRNDNSALNIFEQVDKIIQKAKFLFLQDSEVFKYGKEEIKITMDELVHLKNKINISQKNEKKKEEEEERNKEENNICDSNDKSKKVEEKNDLLKEKSEKLLFYKNLITNMEVIYENMEILRNKGNNLPIDIKIIVNYNERKEATYYLDQNETSFDIIETFLLNAKDDYVKKLDLAYKEKNHTRYLYGQLFRKLVGYLDGGSLERIIDIFRYILNKNNDEEIKTSKPSNDQLTDYVHNYNDYNKKSFENIYNYLIELFNSNKTSLREQYERISMKEEGKYKGVYLHECEENLIGKYIYELFLQKIGQRPIAQNIMISSKETSVEEIQAFLNRAVLCDYNTLFVVEVNESLSDYQQGIMNNYLNELLVYKLDQYKAENKGKVVEKEKTNVYLNACIVFIYEKKNKELSLVNEIGQYERQDIQLDNDNIEESQMKYKQEIDDSNIIVISSDKCGIGKSFEIKKMIENKKQEYFYFPLGGILTKKVISEKLFNLLEKIKEKNQKKNKTSTEIKEKNKIKNAIHLDLTESEETSLINEFLFSFLITKFYTDKETIIYIPKDIEIYIEIPNCFKDYLLQFGILNIFPRKHLTLAKKPDLDLSKEMITIFQRMVELKTNKEIKEKFLNTYMKNKNYSYYQIIIFIKLFISQYNKFKSKLIFYKENSQGEKIDSTEECISNFAKSTTYFLDGGFQDLIMKDINEKELKKEKKDYIDLLSEAYESDLKNKKFNIPLIFINKEKKVYEKLEIEKIISNKNNNSKDYLKCMKQMLYIDNEVETEENGLKSLLSILNYKSDDYVITNDNFTKMILLVYRIIADIPVIIMGETGCGKTTLIKKLSQILNNGEILVEIINIHPGITDKYLCKKMEEMNEKAEKQKKELWVFFDEINTCLSLSLLTEIFSKKTFNTKQLHNNIRLIGACNPYRKRKQEIERYGYGRENESDKELVYLVQPLPQSLLNFVFSFGALDEEDEKKYIFSIIEKLFLKGEEELHKATKEVVFNCHKYLRETFDTSVVSLREINRFVKIVEFFKEYFSIKRKCEEKEENKITEDDETKIDKQNSKKVSMEKVDKIISIICSVYLCYYIRLINENKRVEFNNQLKPYLITLVNSVKIPDLIKQNLNPAEHQDDEKLIKKKKI